MATTLEKFAPITDKVITNLEGGYFHPNMIKDGRVKDNAVFHKAVDKNGKQTQAESGETMFGIDRVNGADLAKTSPAAWNAFWKLIDDSGASKPKAQGGWSYNYTGGNLGTQLRKYASEIMFPRYNSYEKSFLSADAQKAVDADPRLTFHFSYATWNGSGFFKRFAAPINDAIKKGITDLDQLAKIASDSRANSSIPLIKQSSGKITSLMESMKSFASAGVDTVKENPIKTGLIIGFFLLSGYVVWYKFIKRK